MKMTADTQQMSKTAGNALFLKGDRGEWFGRPDDHRFHKRTTVRAARRHSKAVVRGADLG
jgi:hypothetical protein